MARLDRRLAVRRGLSLRAVTSSSTRFNLDPYAWRVGFREERVARNEVSAREINEEIQAADTRPTSSFIHVLCECGLEDC